MMFSFAVVALSVLVRRPPSLCLGAVLALMMLQAGSVGVRADLAAPAGGWPTPFADALSAASRDGKPVFLAIVLRGCSHCATFKKSVLDDAEFQKFAKENLHLITMDVAPSIEASAEEVKRLDAFATHWKVEGTPVVLLLSPSGEVWKRADGYAGQSSAAYIGTVKRLIQENTKP